MVGDTSKDTLWDFDWQQDGYTWMAYIRIFGEFRAISQIRQASTAKRMKIATEL